MGGIKTDKIFCNRCFHDQLPLGIIEGNILDPVMTESDMSQLTHGILQQLHDFLLMDRYAQLTGSTDHNRAVAVDGGAVTQLPGVVTRAYPDW